MAGRSLRIWLGVGLGVVALSTACSSPTLIPADTQATIDAAVAATIEAIPTATPTRAATATVAPKPTPTGTPTPRPTATLAQVPELGGWRNEEFQEPLTILADLEATTGANVLGTPVVLAIGCVTGVTMILIEWQRFLGGVNGRALITTWVGGAPAVALLWEESGDSTTTLFPGAHLAAIGFAYELLAAEDAAQQFVARVTPSNSSPVTAVFDLAGMDEAVKPVREACGW